MLSKPLPLLLWAFSTPPILAWTPVLEPPALPLTSFVLPAELEITPWATSPALFNPTNMDIDHLGRIWVAEGVNYRKASDRQPAGDRIVILEDSDHDGKCDSSSVFWQDPELVSPLGIAVFDNVVIVSQPPNLLKLTDANRDGKFDPASGDTREVLLTGFNGKNHDHSLHSLTAGPDGKWVFNQGNMSGGFTDKSGKNFRITCAYVSKDAAQASDDGFTYVGGYTVRMNPDGTHAEIIGHNYRNSYEQTITSKGHVFQNDNDDPPACRTSHVLEHGNAGFFSNDGTRFWNADIRPGQPTAVGEWRQEDPGSMPAGDVYGGGSPTGIAFYENGALGERFNGTLLSCESARNVIFGYQPAPIGAGFKMERSDFLTTNPEKQFDGADFTGGVKQKPNSTPESVIKFNFRPSDVCVGPDGALYVADWTDPRVGGHQTLDDAASGVIYRVAPRGFKPVIPKLDLSTLSGAVTALKSPAVNVRSLGFEKLKTTGAPAYEAVSQVLKDSNSYVAARAIWLLPYLGEKGRRHLDSLTTNPDPSIRLTAFRAIRRTDGAIDSLPYARKLATDPAPEIRAEAALAVRYLSFPEAREVLLAVAKGYDGSDRSYLESLGLGTGHHRADLWQALTDTLNPGAPLAWSDTFARLTWRLMPEAAVPALKQRTAASNLTAEQRELALDSIAFIPSRASAEALMDIATTTPDLKPQAVWWLVNRNEGEWSQFSLQPELEKRGLVQKPVPLVEITVPPQPASTQVTVAAVLALTGDATRGKSSAARCIMCHQIDGAGPDYGPALKGFASRQAPEVVVRSIVEPSFDISHGFEGTAITLKNGKNIHGRIIADGDTVVVRSTGGLTQHIPKRQIAGKKPLGQSLMLNADQLALSAQDVADILAWMKTY